MRLSKRIAQVPGFQQAVGNTAAWFLRLVRNTSDLTVEPADVYEKAEPHLPVIVTMWHGQHFMMPFVSRGHRVKVLVSRHRDGEMNAIAAERLGIGTIRGSGAADSRYDRKGGVGAFRAMLDALAEGYSVALTADVPKVPRVASSGIVKLAQLSGRLIYPVAIATSRRVQLNTWDRSTINLPFSRMAIVASTPIGVPQDADEAMREEYRRAIEVGLNAATDRALMIVDRRSGDCSRA
ncbi:MAG: lysophospholipid acyltransferase family protein [Xanthobacteraceae bacterium]